MPIGSTSLRMGFALAEIIGDLDLVSPMAEMQLWGSLAVLQTDTVPC